LNYFLNARFYWKNQMQSDEKASKTAHDLGSSTGLPKKQAAASETALTACG
jgi:hypothetical protein